MRSYLNSWFCQNFTSIRLRRTSVRASVQSFFFFLISFQYQKIVIENSAGPGQVASKANATWFGVWCMVVCALQMHTGCLYKVIAQAFKFTWVGCSFISVPSQFNPPVRRSLWLIFTESAWWVDPDELIRLNQYMRCMRDMSIYL